MSKLDALISEIEKKGFDWKYDSLHGCAEICKYNKTSCTYYDGEGKSCLEALEDAYKKYKQKKGIKSGPGDWAL
jgi:hypothetical protein